MADGQAGEEAVERSLLRPLDRRDQVLGRFLAHALQVGQGRHVQPVEIGQAPDQAARDELLDQLLAQAVDVHGVAMGIVLQPPLELLGAERWRVRAAIVDLVRIANDRRAAVGTVSGEDERNLGAVATFVLDPDDLGDDLAGLLDHHGVADADVLAGDLVGVVQRGPLDGRAGEANRLQVGDGRELAGLAHLHADVRDLGDRLLGLVLEGDRPARALAACSQPLALVQVVDLDHQAVGLEIERVPLELPLAGVLDHLRRSSRSNGSEG